MRATQINPGSVYAYQPEAYSVPKGEFLAARAIDTPKAGKVAVHVHHPDRHVPDWDTVVPTRLLAGPWDREPDPQAPYGTDYAPGQEGASLMERRHLTYAAHAEKRYSAAVLQRERAARLSALGIPRSPRHYAGHGGEPRGAVGGWDVTRFDGPEVDRLIDLAEREDDEAFPEETSA